MKFGQDYEAALARGEYPQDWLESAISYKKLKKCIKRVQRELLVLGLDKGTLDAFWSHSGSDAGEAGRSTLLQYTVNGNEQISFTPTLTIVIDPSDGSPMDAWLSPETRKNLRRLAKSSNPETEQREESPQRGGEHLKTVEVPLTADSEFFRILRQELSSLEELQQAEHTRLQEEIVKLGNEIRVLRSSKSKKSKQEIEAWRKIFELYADTQIFLSSHEADAGARDAEHAERQFQVFDKTLTAQRKNVLKLGKESDVALSRFLRINVKLLRFVRFQEINRTALTKIMKKFDKRTALRANSTVSDSLIKSPFVVQDLAKATCFTISEELLNILPQLNDYLCPVCFSISYKPIRLRCQHVFCIRCMVVMQRDEKDHCPLCREAVVMEATSSNIDKKLLEFMKANFKKETKEKQRQNEIDAGVDRWGEAYSHSQQCSVM